MSFDLIHDLITPLLSGISASAIVVFFGRNILTKSIEHTFDKKMEDYKAELNKNSISFQIEKSEFSKKKFEHVVSLYLLILEKNKEVNKYHELMFTSTFENLQKRIRENRLFDDKIKDEKSISSLFLDNALIVLIDEYMKASYIYFHERLTCADNKISKNTALNSSDLKYKYSHGSNIFLEDENNKAIKTSKEDLKLLFAKINNEFKEYISVSKD